MPTTYYVSTTGTDFNSGTTTAAPWRTLQAAASRIANGDTVLIRGGTYGQSSGGTIDTGTRLLDDVTIQNYPGENVIIERPYGSGNAFFIKNIRYLLLRSNPSGGYIKFRNTGTFPNEVGDYVTSAVRIFDNPAFAQRAAFNILDGLIVEQFFGNGLFLDGTADSIIRNCDTSWCATGIRLEGTRSTAEDNYSHDNRYMHQSDSTNPDNDAGAMGISLTRDNGFKVLRNVITGCYAKVRSPDYGTDGGAFEIFGADGGIIGGIGNGLEWTNWGHRGFGDGNVGHDNHGFLETGRLSGDPNNDDIEISYNIAYGKNDFQDLQGESATTPYFLIRALKNGHIHHNVWDVDNGYVANAGFRFQQGGTYGGDITGITIEDNITRHRFNTPTYQFGSLTLPSGLTIRNNLAYYAFDYSGDVVVRSGNDYSLTELATAQSETSKFQDEIWGDTNTNPGANPLFVNATTSSMTGRDYSLQPGSPAIAAGHDGSNIGAYQAAGSGDPDPFPGGISMSPGSFHINAWVLGGGSDISIDPVEPGVPGPSSFIGQSAGGRNRHHRTRDHFGFESDLYTVLEESIGPWGAGTPVRYVLEDLWDRVSTLGSAQRIFNVFSLNAWVQAPGTSVGDVPGTLSNVMWLNAVVQKSLSSSFTLNAIVGHGGSFTIDAYVTRGGSFTLSAQVV